MSFFQENPDKTFTIKGKIYSPLFIIENLKYLVTESRFEKLNKVVQTRTKHIVPMLENIYDEGNIHAVMRTAESYGFYELGFVASKKIRTSSRVTSGADKWLEINKFTDSKSCYQSYIDRGYQILATNLSEDSVDFRTIDYTKPSLVIVGNEKDGVSDTAKEMADKHIVIPTVGLTQSFNLSVAGAILLSWIKDNLEEKHYLNKNEQAFLMAKYLLKSVSHSDRVISRLKEPG